MTEMTESLTRPPGYAPRGTSAGLFSYALLGAGVPFAIMQSLVPVLTNGLDIWLGSILPVLGFAMVLTLVMALGLRKRRLWFVRYMFAISTVLLTCYGLGVTLSLAVLLDVVPSRHPDLRFMSVVNIIYWFVQLLFVWLLIRMLRLHYWQPWTRPDAWELGDETSPRWGMSPKTKQSMQSTGSSQPSNTFKRH